LTNTNQADFYKTLFISYRTLTKNLVDWNKRLTEALIGSDHESDEKKNCEEVECATAFQIQIRMKKLKQERIKIVKDKVVGSRHFPNVKSRL
jgi:hypothetical protein